MARQFGRKYRLIVGNRGIVIDKNAIEFQIVRSTSRDPNSAQFIVYGLDENTIKAIVDEDYPPLNFSAGYEDLFGLVFLGDCRDCLVSFENSESILHLNSGDLEKKLRTARINKTYQAGTPISVVLSDLVKILEVNPGTAKQKFPMMSLLHGSKQLVTGYTASGSAAKELKRLCTSCGYSYSVQNGSLELIQSKHADRFLDNLEPPMIVIDGNLIGSTEIGNDGTVRFKTLLDHNIKPGKIVQLKNKIVQLDLVDYSGQFPIGQDWYVQCEGRSK